MHAPPCCLVLFVAAAISASSCAGDTTVPRPKLAGKRLQLVNLWSDASIVAVGQIRDPRRVGKPVLIKQQNASELTVYPCEAALETTAVLKGELPTSAAHVLWFSYFNACSFGHQLGASSRAVQKVWFLRSDRDWLRPVFDDSLAYLGLFQPLGAARSQDELRVALARAVLTPAAVAESREAFAHRLLEFHSFACAVGGTQLCFHLLAELQKQAPDLRGEICQYLGVTFNQCRLASCAANGPFDPKQALNLQESRRSADLEDASDDRVTALLRSQDAATRSALLTRLQVLSCDVDPAVRKRALASLKKYFPTEANIECVACQ